MSQFPISVEVANSLLRVCEIFDGVELHETFGSASVRLFQRYWEWLRARAVTFTDGGQERIGWHSEHVNRPNEIHVWETSQVLEFLLGFHRLLQAHIARTSLVLSRFEHRLISKDKQPPWPSLRDDWEPVTSLGRSYRIYSEIGRSFVEGWRTEKPLNCSMLLYGPPGTGKTTLAKNLANALGFRLITITVSDFLANGGDEVEARAKAIFDVLRAQSQCVVLFDEIDNFLLDRDTQRYAHQQGVFQFMTPGMLTKLSDLWNESRVIFILATNYENRIDPAIKRPGRIDRSYLLLPPDANARQRTILGQLQKHGIKRPAAKELRALVDKSLFLGFTEIGKLIEGARDKPFRALQEAFSMAPRTIRLSTYRDRFPVVGADGAAGNGKSDAKTSTDDTPPVEEFLCLLALVLEVDRTEAKLFLDPETVSNFLKQSAEMRKEGLTKLPVNRPGIAGGDLA